MAMMSVGFLGIALVVVVVIVIGLVLALHNR
jgi:hypothetical protein